ncbi:MAG: DUF4465 domain-containing protein [Alistipes sp.]|nr:DUF4465 domain-containing protein [Alistipes sp.]
MKKLILAVLAVLAVAALAACSDDDNNNQENKEYITVDFEDVPGSLLAVDAKGSNFYSDYDGEQYTEYTDGNSGLHFGISESQYGVDETEFWNGGTVFSTWNEDLESNDWINQCTVNYVDPTTGYGGNRGSKVFAVVFLDATIGFPDSEEYEIDHLYAMNSAYTTLAMTSGNYNGASPLTYENGDYFYVTITGYGASGNRTGSVDLYLADFRTATSPGILDRWTKVDLTPLGKVNYLHFTFGGTDIGEWGLNTPTYVCIDDIAIVKES